MGTVEQEENRAGRTVVYCLGETGAKVMDRAVLERGYLPNNVAEWFCIRGGGFFDIWDGLSKNDGWFCIRDGFFDIKSAETMRHDFEGKEYLLLLFDLCNGCDETPDGIVCNYLSSIALSIVELAKEQGLKVFSAITTGRRVKSVSGHTIYDYLWCIEEISDCILTLPCTAAQRPEELLWQASQLFFSMIVPQFINLDPEDVREMFPNRAKARLGAGQAGGAQLADAVTDLLSSHEFTGRLKQADGLIIYISCPEAGADPQSIEQAARPLLAAAPPEADILWSVRLEEDPYAETRIIVFAAGQWNRALKQRRAEKLKREELKRETIGNRRPGHLYPDRMPRKKVIKQLWQAVENALRARYGTRPDAAIARRVREEWAAMTRCRDIENVAALYEFTQWLKSEQAPYWMAGTAGSSLILYLLDVTAANPLPPHYMYPCDKHILWHPAAADGFDLPAAIREAADDFAFPAAFRVKADHLLHRNGHNTPWQIHWGPEGWDGEPHYCLHLPKPLKEQVQAFWADHWLGRLQPAAVSVSMRRDEHGCDSMHFSRFCFVFDLDPNEPGAGFCSAAPGQTVHRRAVPFSERLTQFGMQPFAEAPCEPEPEKAGEPDRFVFRDDVFLYLRNQGFSEKDAWWGMRAAMMGEELPSDIAETAPSLDRQTLAQMKKARYLFPKAHAVEYLLFCRRAGKGRAKRS